MNDFNVQTTNLESIKEGFFSPLGAILKYIYNYNGAINENFFGNDKNIIQEKDINEFIEQMDNKIDEVKKMKKDLSNTDISEIEKKFLLNSLNTIGLKFILFKKAVYLEAEKGGYNLNEKTRNDLLKQVNKIQDMVYGPEISSIESEKNAIIKNLSQLFNKNNAYLSDKEKNVFKIFLDEFRSGDDVLIEKGNESKEENKKNLLENSFLSKEKFEELFYAILDLYDLDGWRLSIENVGNFSVRKSKKQIVCPENKIEKTSIKRIFQLIDHEIGVHTIRRYNTEKTIRTEGDAYLEGEEGFATLCELLFDKKLEEIEVEPTIHHITTFIAENFDGEKTLELLKIYFKLSNPNWSEDEVKNNAKDRLFRTKRFVSLKEKGANRKDVSYTRGQNEVVDYLKIADNKQKKEFIEDFYFSRLSLNDQKLVKEFRQKLGINENELRYPLWIGKILYKKLNGDKIFLSKLKEEDFRFNNIEKLEFNTKKKLVEILSKLKQ